MRSTAQRTGTTVVAVVGTDAADCVRRLGEAVNVVAVSVDPDDPPLEPHVTHTASLPSLDAYLRLLIEPQIRLSERRI